MLDATVNFLTLTENILTKPERISRYSFGGCLAFYPIDRKNKPLTFRFMRVTIRPSTKE
jgi:hypothetical protein